MKQTAHWSREELTVELNMENYITYHANVLAAGEGSSTILNNLVNSSQNEVVRIAIPSPPSSSFPTEWGKTAVAFTYAIGCFILTTIMISVVHERVPPKEVNPPLPDKFFDLFDRVEWAFTICEINMMILAILWILQWSLLKHKSIIARRFLFILGTLYLYRCITMYITTLPVPGMHFECSPKLKGDWQSQMWRVLKLFAGAGLSITGSHQMCGDYLYSGHTVSLTLTYLFIKEYSPKHFWWYHWICGALSIIGVCCILFAHDHYSIDVVIAYFITTRLFWCYHTMANRAGLKAASQSNFLSRVWWFGVFQYLERNVKGIVPRSYYFPSSWRSIQWATLRYSRIDSD